MDFLLDLFIKVGQDDEVALDSEGMWQLYGALDEIRDKQEGVMGHMVLPKPEFMAVTDFIIAHYGTDGKLTCEEWTKSFPEFFEKVKPFC